MDWEEDSLNSEGFIGYIESGVDFRPGDWFYIGEFDSDHAYTNTETYSDIWEYRIECNEETGNWKYWAKDSYRLVKYKLYTRWTDWEPIEKPLSREQLTSFDGWGSPGEETQERILYRYRRR